MKFSAFKAFLLVILSLLVSLSSCSDSSVESNIDDGNSCVDSVSSIVENISCTMLVLKPYNQCITYYKIQSACCDAWCTDMSCTQMVSNINCTILYKPVNECCQGYSGEECLPVCNNTCSINSYCSAPDTCSCLSGWKGVNCTEVSGLKVTQVQSDTISLSWNVPVNESNINGYYIHIENDQYSYNKSVFDVINESKFEGLTPATSYRACVAPLVFEGEGTSTCLNVQTHIQAPTTPPGDVTILIISDTAFISWTPPIQPNGGNITEYTVYINNTVNTVSKTMTVDGNVTSVRMEGSGLGISVRVSASTEGGEGVISPYTHHTTTLDTASISGTQPEIDIDAALTLNIVSYTSALLSWLPPPQMNVPFYILSVSRDSSSQPMNVWVLRKDQSLQHTMDTLKEYVPYKLDVFYGNGNGRYQLLYQRVFFTKEGAPLEYPIDISGYRSTDESINVTWAPLSPSDARGLVLDYTIRYAKADRSCDYIYNEVNRSVSVQSPSTVMLGSVSVSSNYCVGVAVSNKAGEGPLSPLVFVPVLSHSYFMLTFHGISNCASWKKNASSTMELTNILAGVLNRNCSSCIKSDSYFVTPMVHCGDDDQINYSATIIGTLTHSSSQLVQVLTDWSQSDPELLINGAYLYSVDSESTQNPSSDTSSQEDLNIAAIVLGALLIVAITGWIATVVVCVLYRNKATNLSTVGPTDSTSSSPPPNTSMGMQNLMAQQSSKEELLYT